MLHPCIFFHFTLYHPPFSLSTTTLYLFYFYYSNILTPLVLLFHLRIYSKIIIMNLFTSLTLLASTVTAATASPLLPRADNEQGSFHLKTINADQDAHNNLYVYGYHTGAGLNDAVLSSDAGKASKGHLNGTSVQFDLGSDFPWGLQMVGATDYVCKFFLPLYLIWFGLAGWLIVQRGSRFTSTLVTRRRDSRLTRVTSSGRNRTDSGAGWVCCLFFPSGHCPVRE